MHIYSMLAFEKYFPEMKVLATNNDKWEVWGGWRDIDYEMFTMEIVCRNVICLIFNIFTLSVIRLEVSEDQRQFWENKKVPGEFYFHSWDSFFPPKEWICGLVENKWYSVCSKIGYSYLQLASYFEGVSIVLCPFQQNLRLQKPWLSGRDGTLRQMNCFSGYMDKEMCVFWVLSLFQK